MNSNTETKKDGAPFSSMIPEWLRGWKGIWVLVAGTYAVVYSAWVILKWTDPAYEVLIAGLAYLPLGFFSAICSSYAATRKELDPRTRRAWGFIAFSMIALSAGDILYMILENTRGIGFPDIPDIFYLVYYPLAFLGIAIIPSKAIDPGQNRTWRFDLTIIITSITSVLWYFIIAPTAVAGGGNWAEILVAGAYPAMDVLLLASIAGIFFRTGEINTRQALYLLGTGLLFYVVADIGYAWQQLQNQYLSGSWVDVFWTFSYFVIGLAALRQASLYLKETITEDLLRANWRPSLLPFAALGTSVFVSLYASATGNGTGLRTNGLIIGTAIAVFVTLARQIITIRENLKLVGELNIASGQLRMDAKVLEERVSERTQKLESQTQKLNLAVQTTRDIALAPDMDTLLNRSTALIRNRFNLYHTAVYLLDQKREHLFLTASPTEAGKLMLASNHKLGLWEDHIISRVAETGNPRILSGLEQDASRARHPLLPDTRSEMALPLKTENRTIGVLDLHSNRPQAFSEEDVAIMQIITDQMTIAIERTRLSLQVEENLKELEQAYGRTTRERWQSLAESGLLGNKGYRFDNVRIQAIATPPEPGIEAMQSGKMIVWGRDENSRPGKVVAAIPVKLRGQSIGVVTVKLREGYNASAISTVEQAVERLAVSLETARLFEEARLRADREQAVAQVVSAIGSASEFEAILRTTVEEIGKSLGDSEVSIQITEQLE